MDRDYTIAGRTVEDYARRIRAAIKELHRIDAGFRPSKIDAARDAAQRLECLLEDVGEPLSD